MRERGRFWLAALAVLVGVASLLAACSKDGEDSAKFDKVGSRITESDSGASTSGGLAALPGGARKKGTDVSAQAKAERDVVYTSSLRVRVGDASKAATTARSYADDAGGYLAKQDADLTGAEEVAVTLRVPSARFDDVVERLAALGTVQDRSIDSDDVTDQVVDLKGRLENAKASADRLRELLAKAEVIQNVVTIEDRLTQRETEIEQLEGQLQVVQDQVQLATIRVTFTEKAKEASPTKGFPGFTKSLRAGGRAVVGVVLVIVAVVAFLLPFVPFALVGWFGYRRWRRAHPSRTTGSADAAPWGNAPAPPTASTPAPAPSPPGAGGDPSP